MYASAIYKMEIKAVCQRRQAAFGYSKRKQWERAGGAKGMVIVAGVIAVVIIAVVVVVAAVSAVVAGVKDSLKDE